MSVSPYKVTLTHFIKSNMQEGLRCVSHLVTEQYTG